MDRIDCEGAPRDLGGDQGRACRLSLRARCGGRWPRLPRRLREPAARRALRDLQRYFPHQYEQLIGMARAAGLSFGRLAGASLAALAEPNRALGYCGSAGPRLVAAAPLDALLRRCRAEGRFATRELTRPLLTAPLLALNEAGLAAAASGAPGAGECAAPASLLLRDCVERFERVGPASDWCMTRPCAPGTTILLADAGGELAAVEIATGGRRVVLPRGSVLLPDAEPPFASDFAKLLDDAPRRTALLQEAWGAFAWAEPAGAALHV